MLNFFDRLEEYRKTTGLSTRAFEKKAGISNGLIGRAAKRGDGQLSQDNIVKILETYEDLDADWLLTGRTAKRLETLSNVDIVHYIQDNLEEFMQMKEFNILVDGVAMKKENDEMKETIKQMQSYLKRVNN